VVRGDGGALESLDWRTWSQERDDGVASAPSHLDTAGVCFSTFMPAFSLMILDKVYHASFLLLTVDSNIWSVLITISFPILYFSTTYLYLRVICKDTHFPLD
jgi:hypothetical protein